ncbi:ATP-dependent Clp protease ATP-binding subunit [Candidatus Peregrinibacteria bacterium]|nr:ATP-dependent Clp protease ATP-binding subunit [Candidatus Peregrinibacteria bacterium]
MKHQNIIIRWLKNSLHLIKVFPWWFSHGMWGLFRFIKRQTHILFFGLGIRPLRKNLLQPLYGMDKLWERGISILVRFGHFAVLGGFAFIGALALYLFFFAYLLLPFLPVFFLSSPGIILLIYLGLLSIYLGLKEKTKPYLQKQIGKKEPRDILEYANKEIKKLFRNKKLSFNEKIEQVFRSSSGKEFFGRLERNIFTPSLKSDSNTNISKILQNLLQCKDSQILKSALKNAWKQEKKHIKAEDILYSVWFNSKHDTFWESLDLKEKQIEEAFSMFGKKEKHRKYQLHWAAYSMFQNKHGIDKGLTSPYSKKLNEFTRDITRTQKAANITPLIARKKEYEHILNAIKHPGAALLLIGNAGVGKSRIIEYLAENIAIDEVPVSLQDQRISELDVGRILSGDATNASQEGGKNLISVLDDATKAKHIILTIDNLATLTGDNMSALFNLSILSKYIENKKIRIIATSTQEDFNNTLNKNPTYIRQFTKIAIEPLNSKYTKDVLEYHAINLERQHETIISQNCFDTIIDVSLKHTGDISNPAKSLILLEESVIAHAQQDIISSEDIKKTLEKNTGIRLTKIKEDERKILQNLEIEIHKTIVGQDYAVNKIADALRRARLDLHDYEGPIAKFLFVGPTGVGKTELAKTVARIHFGSEEKMLRLDMSEFQDISSIKRLIGDNGNSGLLTEPVRNTAHMLILFDELEKAHPDILNLFLQLLDDGRITDGKGKRIDFRNTIIVATSNAGANILWERLKAGTGFSEIEKEMKEKILIKHFRPEFLNRFNNLIVFEPLQKQNVVFIAEKLLKKTKLLFKKKEIFLDFTNDAAENITEDAFTFEMGARPLKNMIIDRLESGIAKGMLSAEFSKGDRVIFNGRNLKKSL